MVYVGWTQYKDEDDINQCYDILYPNSVTPKQLFGIVKLCLTCILVLLN